MIATDQAKRVSSRATTDAQGHFAFPQLQPSNYTITVEAPGFKKLERRDQVLNANDKLSIGDLALEVGAVDQTIEVQAQSVELKTESSERSDAIFGKQLQNVAVNGRGYLALAARAPGIVSTVNLQTAGSGGLGSISANGARTSQNNLALDGIGNVGQQRRAARDAISVVTKSGTNDFHGSGYLFHRHEGLNANNWKNNRDGNPRSKYRYNDPGYTIGGPVIIPNLFNRGRDKLFFFWSQEFQQQLTPHWNCEESV